MAKLGHHSIEHLAEKGADFSEISLAGHSAWNIDFRKVKNLTADNWLSATHYWGCKLPESMDFSNISLKDKDIYGVDFSGIKGLTVENWLSAKDLRHSILPKGLDFSGVSFRDKDISNVDFSRATGLTLRQLVESWDFNMVTVSSDIPIGGLSEFTSEFMFAKVIYIAYPKRRRMVTMVDFAAAKKDPVAQRYLLIKSLSS